MVLNQVSSSYGDRTIHPCKAVDDHAAFAVNCILREKFRVKIQG